MLRLIIGAATLAAAGYAAKEYCETEVCPWDDISYTPSTSEKSVKKPKNGKIAKEFHKHKKEHYQKGMQHYQSFLEKHDLQDRYVKTDVKLSKQKFPDDYVSEDAKLAIERISHMIEILSYNIEFNSKLLNERTEIDKEDQELMSKYAQNLFALAHLEIFIGLKLLNKNGIAQAMYEAMSLSVQKDTIHVNLQQDS
jgi:hypothetical protein